jgi:hypothetical protein
MDKGDNNRMLGSLRKPRLNKEGQTLTFTPIIPARVKTEPQIASRETQSSMPRGRGRNTGRDVNRGRRDLPVSTASGPFSLGPASRDGKQSRNSVPSVSVISSNVPGETKDEFVGFKDDIVILDDFELLEDPLAPLIVHKKSALSIPEQDSDITPDKVIDISN